MAVYVQFLSRETGKSVEMVKIDEDMARAFGAEPHPRDWFRGWYNHVGLSAACGTSLVDIIKRIESYANDAETDREIDEVIEIVEAVKWLDRHYRTDSWSGR